jgi:hypothetical protein
MKDIENRFKPGGFWIGDNVMYSNERDELIEQCALIADKYAAEEKVAAKEFGKQDNRVAQATHAILSVICSRIADDIRKMKCE